MGSAVAEHVRADVAEGVLAEQARAQLDALEEEAIGGELRRLLVREAVLHRQALGVARLLQELPEAHAVARLEAIRGAGVRAFVPQTVLHSNVTNRTFKRALVGGQAGVEVLPWLGVALALEEPMLVELGVLLDVFVAVFVMGNTIFHINREFDPHEADRLDSLKD